jgi:hypothetical protein
MHTVCVPWPYSLLHASALVPLISLLRCADPAICRTHTVARSVVEWVLFGNEGHRSEKAYTIVTQKVWAVCTLLSTTVLAAAYVLVWVAYGELRQIGGASSDAYCMELRSPTNFSEDCSDSGLPQKYC